MAWVPACTPSANEAVGGQVVYLVPTVAAFMRVEEGSSQSEAYTSTQVVSSSIQRSFS